MYLWMNIDQTVGSIVDGTHVTVVEPEHPRWGEFLAARPAPYTAPSTDPWPDLRTERDRLLLASDPRALPDYPQTAAERAAWLAYRQALRDLPGQTSDPMAPVWPQPPAT